MWFKIYIRQRSIDKMEVSMEYIRSFDDLGRIVIPLDIRKQLYSGKDGAGEQVKILFEPDKQGILLIPLSGE